MDFYFTDRSFNLLEIISTDGSTSIELANEEDKVSIENGNRTLSGTLYFDKKNSVHTKEVGAVGNYILYHDKNQKDVWMTIVEMEHNPKAGTHDFVAEDAGLDLLNELLGPFSADKAYPISYYIEKFTFDSGFELGFNEIANLTRKLEWEGESTTALARLVSVATQFDNAEIEFSFDISGTTVIKKYVNIYKKRGKDNRQTLYVNVDIDNIIVKSDIYELATALYVEGGTPEGKNSPITLKGYQWTDPDNRFELTASSGILKDKVNGAKWSRLLPGEANKNGAYIVRRKSYETTSQKTLLDNALRELKTVSEPAINYDIDILQLPEGVQPGDTIYLVDENEEVYLSARVLELTYQYSISSYKATLGDYLIKDAGISQSLIDLANQLQEQANKKTYKVVLEPTATQFIDGKGSIDIRVKVLDGTLDVSTNFSEYHWTRIDGQGNNDPDWSKTTNKITILPDEQPLWTYICEVSKILEDSSFIVGSDRVTISSISNGSTGIPGPKGEDGKTSYFHIAYASDEKGTNFSTDDPSGRGYMGTYTDFELVDSSDWQKYAWQKVEGEKGVDGLQGEKGDQGIAGPKGEDGKTQYTHIAYANSADGKIDFSVSDSNREYVGMYVDFLPDDSTKPTDYAWSKIKGADGTQGTPGKPGADGKTPYFHTAWANSADGKTGFSTTDSVNKQYLGSYTDFIQADSNDPSLYSWSLIKGADGDNGLNGDGQLVFNNTLARYPISGGTDINRETIGWSYPGANGTIQILEAEADAPIYRIIRMGGTTATTKYIYTKNIPVVAGTTVTFKGQVRVNEIGSSTYTIPTLRFFSALSNPADNAQATTVGGNSYVNGRTDGTVQVGNGIGVENVSYKLKALVVDQWSDFEISVVIPDGVSFVKFLTYNSNPSITAMHDYRMITAVATQKGDQGPQGLQGLQGPDGKQGVAGPKGEDGKTQYTHIAYADNANGGGFSQDPENKNYIGMYVDFVAEDSTDPKKYKWQLTKGVAGDQGIAGKPGADGKTPYFHTAWADSKDGKVNFSTTDATDRGYIGTYTDFVENDSTDPTKYMWTELVGALDINSVNYALESRFENLSIQGGTGNYRRKHIALSETIKKDNKVQFSFKWTNISGTAPTKISVVMWGTAQASTVQTFSVSGATGNISGSAVLTNDASFIYIYMGEYAQPDNNELQLEFITVNKGDKLSGWTPSPVDKVELNNLLFNSTWNLGGWGWDNNHTPNINTSYFEKVAAEIDKPNSSILHGKPNAATTQQIRSNPYLPVKAGMLIHIKFDYRENSLGNTGGNPFLSIRNFPEPDTPNAQANALEYWYFRRNDTSDPTKVWSNWTRFEIYCKITQDGYLSIQPYDGSNTGTHETWYREIMVTAGGSLQGDWSANYNDFQTQIDDNKNTVEGIPKVYTQANTPIGMKDGDMWWKMSNNLVAGYYVYGAGKWNPQSIDQAILNIVQLNAVTINGSTISGSRFVNAYDFVEESTGIHYEGSTEISNGTFNNVTTQYIKNIDGNYYRYGKAEATIALGALQSVHTFFNEAGNQTSKASANLAGGWVQLELEESGETYRGVLDAKALTRMPWKNLAMNSKFETKENNPPQYKIVYQLDGTKLIKFRGQFGLKTGQMLSNTTYYPFQDGTGTSASGTSYIPVEIRPDRTSFGYGAGPKEGGRLAMTTTPRFVANPAANADYLGMDAFQYIIE